MKTWKRCIAYLLLALFVLPINSIPVFTKAAAPSKISSPLLIDGVAIPKSGKVEIESKRTAQSKTYLKSDSSKELVISQSPIHYSVVENGKSIWKDIDINLESSSVSLGNLNSSQVKNKSNNFELLFSKEPVDNTFSLSRNGSQLSLDLKDIRSTNPATKVNFKKENLVNNGFEVKDNRVTYKNVFKDTDINYYSMSQGIKEDIVLNSYSGQDVFVYGLNLDNAYYEKQSDGSYKFFNKNTKEFIFSMPRFFMWDSKGGKDNEQNQYSYDVQTEIVQTSNGFEVILTANNNWLSAKDRVFPIIIDPSLTTYVGTDDAFIESGYPTVQTWDQRALYVGHGQTKGVMRTLIPFDLPNLDYAKILGGRFEAYQYGNCSGICTQNGVSIYMTTGYNPYDVYWNNQPNLFGPVGNGFQSAEWGTFSADVTQAVQHWYYGNSSGSFKGSLEFVQDGEDQWGFRTWAAQNNPEYGDQKPRLIIDYNDFDAQYYPDDVSNMTAGTTVDVPVIVRNIGRNWWYTDQTKLSYHWVNNTTGERVIQNGLLSNLPVNVGPGDNNTTIIAKVQAPPNSGSFSLQWDLIQPGITWFSDQGVPTANRTVNISPPSFSSMTHLGTESYYAKAGPVDLATGNLSYSSTDLGVASSTGQLNITRSYNSKTLDQTSSPDGNGYIKNWLINGPYKENNQAVRLTNSYIPNENLVKPSTGSTSNGNLWLESNSQQIDFNSFFNISNAFNNGAPNNMVAYSNTYIFSPDDQKGQIRVGSDDGIRIWLNGDLIHSNDIYRGVSADNDVINIDLKKGWNSLIFKVTQGVGGWGLVARITSPDGSPIQSLKYTLNNPEVFQSSNLLGKGWTLNFDARLFSSDPENVYFRDGTGTVNIYTKKSDGNYNQPAGTSLDLIKNSDGTYSLSSKSGSKVNFRADGKINNQTDIVGNALSYKYNDKGQCIEIRDGTRFIMINYGTGGNLSSVSDELGDKYTYLFQPSPLGSAFFWAVARPDGNLRCSYKYDSNQRMSAYLDSKGKTTKMGYAEDRISEISDPLGNKTSFTYGEKTIEVKDPLGRTIKAKFDNANLLTSITNPKGYTEAYLYDKSYNLISVFPILKQDGDYYYKWSYEYDSNNNLIAETDTENKKTTYTYNGIDLLKVTNPKDESSEYTYVSDGRHLVASEKNPEGNITKYEYDAKGRQSAVTDSKGAVTRMEYSDDGDLLVTITPKKEKTTYTYDKIGRKISEKSPLGRIVTNKYNQLSQLIEVTDPAGLKLGYEYDLNGNKIKETNPKGASKKYDYDALNHLIKSTDELGAAIKHEYDAVGNEIKTTDAKGKTTLYSYDMMNQLVKTIGPDKTSASMNYDQNGNLASVKDQKGNESSLTVNKDGSVKSTTDKEGTVKIDYDANGNPVNISSTSQNENSQLSYDKNGNPIKTVSNIEGTSTKTYDTNGSQASASTSTTTINFNRDTNGNVSEVSSAINQNNQSLGVNILVKDEEGKLTAINKANGDKTSIRYDKSGRISGVINTNKKGTDLGTYIYQYDLASNVTKAYISGSPAKTYNYDVRDQLIQEDGTSYSYDSMGNRTSMTVLPNATDALRNQLTGLPIFPKTTTYLYDEAGDANRLLTVKNTDGSKTDFSYDEIGNVVKRADSSKGSTTYQYDSDNYLTKTTLSNGTTVEYVYDKITKHRIQRIETIKNGTPQITKFTYDGDRLVSETDGAGKLTKSYTWDEDEDLISISIPDVNGNIATYFYIKNAKGDITGLSDASGNKVVTYEYDAWGNIIKSSVLSKSVPKDLDKQNPRLYSGYWYDSTLGLYFMKTRMYDPVIGRFLSRDTERSGDEAIDYNPYLYCGNNPVDKIDPSGKGFFSKLKQFASGVVTKTKEVVSKAVEKASAWAANGLESLAKGNIPVISWAAKKTNQMIDWTGGSYLKSAIAGFAIAVAVVGAVAGAIFVAPYVGAAAVATYNAVVAAGYAVSQLVVSAVTAATTKAVSMTNTTGTYSIYISKAGDYIGMTKNFATRSAYWASQGRVVSQINGLTGLTYAQARGCEQALIEYFGGPKGQILVNQINSIASGTVRYNSLVPVGRQMIQALGYML